MKKNQISDEEAINILVSIFDAVDAPDIVDEVDAESRKNALIMAIKSLEKKKENDHFRARTIGLHATDRPDLIPEKLRHVFFEITE